MSASIASQSSHTSQLDEYLSRQLQPSLYDLSSPPVPKALNLPIVGGVQGASTIANASSLDSLLHTPVQQSQGANLMSMVDVSFGVTSTAKKRGHTPSVAKSFHSKGAPTLDSYLGSDSDGEGGGDASDLSVSEESYREVNDNARKRDESYSKRVIEDANRRR